MGIRSAVPARLRRAIAPAVAILLASLAAAALSAAPAAGAAHHWARSWDPRPGYDIYQVRLAEAPSGGVYVGTTPCSPSHQASGIAVARYASGGKRVWGKLLSKAAGAELAAVAAGPQGGLLVLGDVPGKGGAAVGFLACLGPGGAKVWTRHFSCVRGGSCTPHAMTVTGGGVVSVCGTVVRPGGQTDAFVARFGAGGSPGWRRFIAGSAGVADAATAIAGGAKGRVYVAGMLDNGTKDDAFVARFSGSGHPDWLSSWNNPAANENDWAWDVAASKAGVVIAGSTPGAWDEGNAVYDSDGLVLKYTTGGAFGWVQTVPGVLPWGGFNAVTIDGAGNVAAAGGITRGSPADYKAVLFMLSPSGAWQYLSWLPDPTTRGGFDALTMDGGMPLAAGYTSAGGDADVLLFGVTPGLQTWLATFGSSAGADDAGTDVLCTASGVYVGGSFGNRLGLVRY